MRNRKQLAVGMAAVLSASVLSSAAVLGAEAIRIDMTDNNDAAWADIAMANDDTVDTGVNIRSSADPNSDIVGFLYRGGAVRVLDKGAEWTEVQSGSVTGYMKNEYLVYGTEAKGLAEHYGSYGAKASWDDVKVFSGQSGSSSIVDTASDGDTYRMVHKDGDWIALETGSDSVAYVPAEDVSVVMVVETAIPVGGENTSDGFKDLGYVEEQSSYDDGSYDSGSYDDGSYDSGSYDDGSYDDGSWDDGSYDDGSWDDGSSDDGSWDDGSYDDGSWDDGSYDDGSWDDGSYDDGSWDDGSYDDGSYYDGSYDSGYTATSYSTDVDTSGSLEELQARASQLYQEYVAAQNAADEAIANGSGEQAIMDTAAAAVAAYEKYVKVQNAADAASWGGSADTSASAAAEDTTAAEDTGYTEEPAPAETQTNSAASQVSASDLNLLAALIYCEAGNQPYEGQVAVGAVVMNRIASGAFPNNIHDVIYQAGQFMPTWDGALPRALANGSGGGYVQAATDALNGVDPTGGALYFNVHQGYGKKIGAHWFF